MTSRAALACVVLSLLLGACAALPGGGKAPAEVPGTATRPQLTAAQAQAYSRAKVLGAAGPAGALVHDGWDPLAEPVITGRVAPPMQYQVQPGAANGRTVFATVQAAVNQAHIDITSGAQTAPRVYIGVAPGSYHELVYVPASTTPITIWGLGADPTAVRIHFDIDAAMPVAEYKAQVAPVYEAPGLHADIARFYQDCTQTNVTARSCMVVMWVKNSGFQLRNVTVANSYFQSRASQGSAHQAVAFKSEGADRIHLEQVHLLGYQDTLYLKTPRPDSTVRAFVHRSLVAGDVDFIYGPATAYFLSSEIRWVGQRRGLNGGYIGAPSTNLRVPYGFVFEDCDFTSDGAGPAVTARVHLARQWFTGAPCSPYGDHAAQCTIDRSNNHPGSGALRQLTLETVGKMVVLRSRLGAHLLPQAPWAPWQTDRAHKAYRPAQYHSEDFWSNLVAAGRDPAALGYQRQTPAQPFLGEYRNSGPGHGAGDL